MSKSRRQMMQETVALGFGLFTMSPFVPAPGSPNQTHTGKGRPDLSPNMRGKRQRDRWRMHELTEAWRRAAASGRPLLIIVVPANDDGQVGGAWGELFTNASDETIAALTQVELVTATQEEIHTVLPAYTVTSVGDEPLVVRIEAAEMPARYEAFYTELVYQTWDDFGKLEEQIPGYEREARMARAEIENGWIDQRVNALEALVLSAVRPEPSSLGGIKEEAIAARRIKEIPGSRWGSSGGCGTHYSSPDPLEKEGDVRAMYACGMGHVNQRSSRFLDFLTHDPQNPVEEFLDKQRRRDP